MVLQARKGTNYYDLLPYVISTSIAWKRSYVEGGNKMTMQDGGIYPDRIKSKEPLFIAFRPVTAAEQAFLLSLFPANGLTLKYTDRETAATTTGYFYPGDIPSTYLVKRQSGVEYYGGLTVTLEPR